MRIPITTTLSRHSAYIGFLIFVTGSLVALFKLNYLPFLQGRWSYYHDSLVPMAETHLYYQWIFSGQLPLWNSYLSAGTPLWPSMEAFASFDPIAFFVWGLSILAQTNSLAAFQSTCFLWLLVFSLGGMFLSKKILCNRWIQFTVFIILVAGPMVAGVRAQAGGFLIPFRYTPWVLLSYLTFREKADFRNTLFFGLCLMLSQSGFQLGYQFLFMLFFAGFYEYFSRGQFRTFPWKPGVSVVLIFLMGNLASFISGWEMLNLFALPREFHQQYFIFPWERFLRGIFDAKSMLHGRHGHSYIGMIPAVICIWFLVTSMRSLFSRRSTETLKLSALEKSWIASFLVMLFMVLGGAGVLLENRGTILGVRNWGFALMLVILCQSQLFAMGYKQLSKWVLVRRRIGDFLFCVGLIGFFFWSDLALHKPHLPSFFIALALLVLVVFTSAGKWHWTPFILAAFTVADLYHFSGNQLYYLSRKSNVAQPEFPSFTPQQEKFHLYRLWAPDLSNLVPYHYEAPAIWGISVAYLAPFIPRKVQHEEFVNGLTHAFESTRFHRLIEGGISLPVLKNILGHTGPVIRIVHTVIPSLGLDDSVTKLKEVSDASVFNRAAVIEGTISEKLSQSFKPSSSRWTLESFKSTELKLNVEMLETGILIYADNIDAHWKVYVDGDPRPLLVANGFAKGVYLNSGKHQVCFSYEPKLYVFSFWLRYLLPIFLLGALAWVELKSYFLSRRRPIFAGATL